MLPLGGLFGRVGRTTTFRNLKAEGIADEKLVTDKRCNEHSAVLGGLRAHSQMAFDHLA